jgi:hypothetical protein
MNWLSLRSNRLKLETSGGEKEENEREREKDNVTTVCYPDRCGVFILRSGDPYNSVTRVEYIVNFTSLKLLHI